MHLQLSTKSLEMKNRKELHSCLDICFYSFKINVPCQCQLRNMARLNHLTVTQWCSLFINYRNRECFAVKQKGVYSWQTHMFRACCAPTWKSPRESKGQGSFPLPTRWLFFFFHELRPSHFCTTWSLISHSSIHYSDLSSCYLWLWKIKNKKIKHLIVILLIKVQS